MRILLGGVPFGRGNIGDEAILNCVVGIFKRNFPDAGLAVATADADSVARNFKVETLPAFGFDPAYTMRDFRRELKNFLYLRHLLGSMSCRVLVPGVLRIAGAGALLALGCYLVHLFCFDSFTDWGFIARFGALALGGVGGAALYGIGCVLFRVPEMQAIVSRVLRRG